MREAVCAIPGLRVLVNPKHWILNNKLVFKVRKAVTAIPGLRVLGDPKLCIIAFTSDQFHIYRWVLKVIQIQRYSIKNL